MSARRKNIMLGTAGYVDHGKTAVVKLLTGCDTDNLTEEKQRGMTIDLGFAPCLLADDRIVGVRISSPRSTQLPTAASRDRPPVCFTAGSRTSSRFAALARSSRAYRRAARCGLEST